jgi:hypothetical protein
MYYRHLRLWIIDTGHQRHQRGAPWGGRVVTSDLRLCIRKHAHHLTCVQHHLHISLGTSSFQCTSDSHPRRCAAKADNTHKRSICSYFALNQQMSYLLAYPPKWCRQRLVLQVRKKGRAINGLISAAVAKGQESCGRSGMSLTGGKFRVGLVCKNFWVQFTSLQ